MAPHAVKSAPNHHLWSFLCSSMSFCAFSAMTLTLKNSSRREWSASNLFSSRTCLSLRSMLDSRCDSMWDSSLLPMAALCSATWDTFATSALNSSDTSRPHALFGKSVAPLTNPGSGIEWDHELASSHHMVPRVHLAAHGALAPNRYFRLRLDLRDSHVHGLPLRPLPFLRRPPHRRRIQSASVLTPRRQPRLPAFFPRRQLGLAGLRHHA